MITRLERLEDTQRFAERLLTYMHKGSVICLTGDLGAGKTTLTQFLCTALGVDDYVTSPTFTLMNTYDGLLHGEKIEIHHFDVYRIFDPDEMFEIGFEDFLYGEGICIVEWANLVSDFIPKDAIWIELKLGEDGVREALIKGNEVNA